MFVKFRFIYSLLITILLICACVNLSFRNTFALKAQESPTIQTIMNRPLVIAHRGGARLAPENTVAAFEKARALGVDVIEMDIRMSLDGRLVVMHDETVNRTTNGKGKVSDLSFQQLKSLDAGYRFRDARGRHTYRGKGVAIPALEEIFAVFPDVRLILDIKHSPSQKGKYTLEKKLWHLIHKHRLEKRVLVFSFRQDILERFDRITKGTVPIAASRKETGRFLTYHKMNMNHVYKPSTDVFLIPPPHSGSPLSEWRWIRELSRLNIPVLYWTVNDEKTMKLLMHSGATGIITDRPDRLIKLLNKLSV